MKRSFTLIEILISILIVGMIATATTIKVLEMKDHYTFVQDQAVLNDLLIDAQFLTIATDTQSEVVLSRTLPDSWTAQISFSLESHPLLQLLNAGKTHEFRSFSTIQGQADGVVRIALIPSFGETDTPSLELVSTSGEKNTAVFSLEQSLKKSAQVVITDDLLKSLEKN